MANPIIKDLKKLTAKKHGLTLAQVEGVINAVFHFQAYVMKHKCNRENLDFPSTRIPHWGVFYCAPYTKYRLTRLKEKHNEIKNTDSSDSNATTDPKS